MDTTPGSKRNNSPSPPQAAEPSSSSPSPPGAAAGAGAETTRRADEVDDEQVERFYALLANIRALRGVIGTAAAAGKRKRPAARGRGDEPPWRPAFRIEDFEAEEISSGGAADAERTKPNKRVCSSRRTQPRSETGSVVVAVNDGDGDGVEQNGPRRAAARGCALTR